MTGPFSRLRRTNSHYLSELVKISWQEMIDYAEIMLSSIGRKYN